MCAGLLSDTSKLSNIAYCHDATTVRGFLIELVDVSERRASVVPLGETGKNRVAPFVCTALGENYAVSGKFAHPLPAVRKLPSSGKRENLFRRRHGTELRELSRNRIGQGTPQSDLPNFSLLVVG